MNYSLIVWSYRRCVMQDDYFGFEIINWLRLGFTVDQDHSFAEVVPLELLFLDLGLDSEADCLSSDGFLDIHALVVNALNLNRVKLSLLVRT